MACPTFQLLCGQHTYSAIPTFFYLVEQGDKRNEEYSASATDCSHSCAIERNNDRVVY